MSLKIMVVDDESLSLKVMRSLAVPLGHTVLTLTDSQEAEQLAGEQGFDLVFVGMPREDGLELTRRIGKSQPASETTVVMLKASHDVETLREAFGAGISFVLPKPIAAAHIIPLLKAKDSPEWRRSRHAARLPLFTDVRCKSGEVDLPMRSMNISETGMLLQSPHGFEVGHEVSVEFKIPEVRASLNQRARIVRKEGADRLGVEFVDISPEVRSAIQLYVMGHFMNGAPQRYSPDFQTRRVWNS